MSASELRPALLPEKPAAAYIGYSPSWLRQRRMEDLKRVAEGKEPLGPRWVAIGASISYRLSDLDKWIEAVAVPLGRVKFRGTRSEP